MRLLIDDIGVAVSPNGAQGAFNLLDLVVHVDYGFRC